MPFKSKIKHKQYCNQYYIDNKEEVLFQQKQYQKENKEKIKKQKKLYRGKNPKKWKEYHKKWQENNPKKLEKYFQQHYLKNKQYIVDYKLSRGCSICGYNKCSGALVFHHPNDDKEFSISTNMNKNLEILKKEIEKCIILCANCHAEIHTNYIGIIK